MKKDPLLILKVATSLTAFAGVYFIIFSIVEDLKSKIWFIVIGTFLLILALLAQYLVTKWAIKKRDEKKKRTNIEISSRYADDETRKIITDILKEDGFFLSTYGNEIAYQNGNGTFSARKMMKFYVEEKKVYLQLWVSQGTGSAIGIEDGLEGAYCAMPKESLKKLVELIKKEVSDER